MKSIKYWSYITLITFFLLVFIELFIRLCFPTIQAQGCDGSMLKDFVYGKSMGLAPNRSGVFFGKKVHIDGNRSRRNGHVFKKKKNSWLHIGDSVTMGVGVDDDSTFSALIANKVDSLNIINPSLIGYSMEDYKNVVDQLIVTDGNTLNIKHITLFYCLNDVYKIQFMRQPSKAYKFFNYIKTYYFTYVALKGCFLQRAEANYEFDKKFYTSNAVELKQAARDILQIAALCKRKNIAFNVVMMPYEPQLEVTGRPTNEYKILAAQLASMNQHDSIQMTDMSLAFDTKESFEDYYLFADAIHLSNAGHRKIANYYLRNIR